jgi:2'-5' RNA ligase
MTKAKGYSLWLMPSGDVYNELAGLISRLSIEYSTPNFEPHVTLIGSLEGSEEDILSKTSQLATLIHPFNIKLTTVDYLDAHFTCLFIKVEKTNDMMKANWKAKEFFSPLRGRQYMPHLSLMYGDSITIPRASKKEIIAEIGKEFGMSFEVRSIHLFSTDGEPLDWYRVKEFTLK